MSIPLRYFITYTIDVRLLTRLTVAFILCTVIGTLTHEFGHYLAAIAQGYNARVNFMSTNIYLTPNQHPMSAYEYFLFTIGGPLETILTGCLGFILLLYFRTTFYNAQQLSLLQWCIVFVTFFWSRQIANLVVWIGRYFINGYYFVQGDEIKLSRYLGVPDLTILIITAIIGLVIASITIFRFIPKEQRLTFILSGLLGGTAGYTIWLVFLGKYILP